jgi:4-carboxymuconolactone decarboxylase
MIIMRKNQRPTVKMMFGLFALLITTAAGSVNAQSTGTTKPEKKEMPSRTSIKNSEQELINLSKQKWQWMAERKVDSLAALFHEKAVFVHMGATMSKNQELDVIKSGGIQYKNAEIQEASVQIIDQTAILLNKIRLTAIVGGNEVINPFVVTEVYVRQGGTWKLASVSFTRLLTQ